MILVDTKRVKGLAHFFENSKAFEKCCENAFKTDRVKVSQIFKLLWSQPNFSLHRDSDVFEKLLCEVLSVSGVSPICKDGVFHSLPNVTFEYVAYTLDKGPIVFCFLESLIEHLKYFDFQSYLLKQRENFAQSYVLTIGNNRKDKVPLNIQFVGIDKLVDVTSSEIDELIEGLSNHTYCMPPKVEVLKSSRLIL